jgi:hypothetical protein
MKSYLLHLASLLIICIGCTIALTPKEYFIFDVPNDGPAIIHTIDATKGDIVSSMSVPQFDSVNISSSHIFYHDIEQKFYIWQELAPTDSFGEGLASNNIMVIKRNIFSFFHKPSKISDQIAFSQFFMSINLRSLI